MAKEFTYRGKTLEQLKAMDLNEISKLLPSRARRSIRRGFTDQQKRLLKKIDLALSGKTKKPVKTHCRDMVILPKMIGMSIFIHDGKVFTPMEIQPEALGMYLGELMLTRKKVAHSAPGIGATKSSSAVSVR